jgi:hypothetical protein
MRAGVDVGAVNPAPGEPFADYVKRMGGVQRPLAGVSSASPNVLLFPRAADGPVATVVQPLVGNEHCPKASFDTVCNQWAGYWGSSITNTWNLTDLTSGRTKSRTGITGVHAAVCGDVGTTKFRVTNANARWPGRPGTFDITVNEGFIGEFVGGGSPRCN